MKNKTESIVLGGGCFWCLEAVFLRVKGVKRVVSGYAGGTTKNPSYQEVSNGRTGHAEVVEISFDPQEIRLEDILKIFFTVHDPTTLNRQGNDIGTQYRSIILYYNEDQKETGENVLKEITNQKLYEKIPVTEIAFMERFYPAEEYHQRYFEKNPDQSYCKVVVAPKIAKLREKYKQFYKK